MTSGPFTLRVYNIVKLIIGNPDIPTQEIYNRKYTISAVAAPTIELSIILQIYNKLHLHVI